MPATIEQVTYEALTLSVAEQARLARTLLDSLATVAEGRSQDEAMLARRREVLQKFVSGEWCVELPGYENARKVDRAAAQVHLQAGND